jgi:hypothetical protein
VKPSPLDILLAEDDDGHAFLVQTNLYERESLTRSVGFATARKRSTLYSAKASSPIAKLGSRY